jgi:hypothetical protein
MFNYYFLKEGEPTLTLYLWNSIPFILVSFQADSSIINTIYIKCIRDASLFLQP